MHANRLNPKVCTELVPDGKDEHGHVILRKCGCPKPADQGMCWECRETALRKTLVAREFWSFCRACGQGTNARLLRADGLCKECHEAGLQPVRWYSEDDAA